MDSTFHIDTVMPLDTSKIRHEIRKVLKDGPTRSTKIVDQVKKKVGSEKTIYRQIQDMSKSGELQANEYSRAHIEYDLVKQSKNIKNTIEDLSDVLNNINENLYKFQEKIKNKKTMPMYLQRLSTIVMSIRQIQLIEARLRIFSMNPAFKKSNSFDEIKNYTENTWNLIVILISQLREETFYNELLMNFIPLRIEETKVKEKS